MERVEHGPTGGPAGIEDDVLHAVRRRLLRQASVFDDPTAYVAGVEDALAAVSELSIARRDPVVRFPDGVRTLRDAAG